MLFEPENAYISAFTVSELGEILPKEVEISRKKYNKFVQLPLGGEWTVYYASTSLNRMTKTESDESEANARAKMLIYLIENNLIDLK